MKRLALVVAVCSAVGAFMPGHCIAQEQEQRGCPGVQPELKRFLRTYFSESGPHIERESVRYSAALVHLRDDATEQVIVYLSGRGFCGSGGCKTLVLACERSGYRVVGDVTITWLPISVLPSKTNGWHDIGVEVRGGGIIPGYRVKLPFDGHEYARNPTTPPAQRLTSKGTELVVIANFEGSSFLYR